MGSKIAEASVALDMATFKPFAAQPASIELLGEDGKVRRAISHLIIHRSHVLQPRKAAGQDSGMCGITVHKQSMEAVCIYLTGCQAGAAVGDGPAARAGSPGDHGRLERWQEHCGAARLAHDWGRLLVAGVQQRTDPHQQQPTGHEKGPAAATFSRLFSGLAALCLHSAASMLEHAFHDSAAVRIADTFLWMCIIWCTEGNMWGNFEAMEVVS